MERVPGVIYNDYTRIDLLEVISDEEYARMSKNLGNVYAIYTTKGYALGQVADIELTEGMYICRFFRKIHKEIPKDIQGIINQKEDYIYQIMLPGMAHWKVKMAEKLGKYPIPDCYETPKYTKNNCVFGKEHGTNAPLRKYWFVIPHFSAICERIPIETWITQVLHKKLTDESWKEDFRNLNSTCIINGKALVDMLEADWSLDKWLPCDFNKSVREILGLKKNWFNL